MGWAILTQTTCSVSNVAVFRRHATQERTSERSQKGHNEGRDNHVKDVGAIHPQSEHYYHHNDELAERETHKIERHFLRYLDVFLADGGELRTKIVRHTHQHEHAHATKTHQPVLGE